jgi:16S rRNA (uracil1498-N3)-methyltransferase
MGVFQSDVPALYYPAAVASGESIRLPEEETRHIRALRLRMGDHVLLLDGMGGRADATIVEMERKGVEIAVQSVVLDRAEGVPYIVLAAGILSDKSRYEWCIEKGVELGLREFIPLVTARSEGHFNANRARRVAVAALKQSQQSYLPTLHDPLTLELVAGRFGSFQRVFFCHEGMNRDQSLVRFLQTAPPAGRTLLLVGPEGGFSDDEFRCSVESGATAVWLGDARLRAETAAVAALVLVGAFTSG